MNFISLQAQKITKSALFLMLASSSQLSAITSNMTHRVMGTSPLLYKMIDYSKHQACFEVAPIFSSMYDPAHTNQNIILNGKSSLIFDQQGGGDVNPMWMNLMSNNSSANYNSTVNFTPKFTESGALFHWYDQSDNNMFIDIKTALVQCKAEVEINEIGGGNGLIPGIMNVQQAFTQSDWNYGKIGASNHVVGLDNIELRFGKVAKCTDDSSSYDMVIAGFGIIEAPTGTGSKAEWLFEPQVGTNHWGLGFGFEALVSGDDDLKFMIAGNYRYLIPAWETRSFDLLGNGQWSRYLSVQDTYGITPTTSALPVLGLPGINFFTQQAYINGRSELNLYTRLQKQFKSSYFELSYNFFCIQQETIGAIKNITPGYGIYALTGPSSGGGGVTTASSATINEDFPPLDPLGYPVSVTTDRFDKLSACATAYATNTLTARLEIRNNKIIYGFGASIEAALSASAISTWSVWAQFGFVFDTVVSSCNDHEFSPELYDLDTKTVNSIHHEIAMDEAGLPEDVIITIQDDFINYHDNFEFSDEDINFNEEIDKLQKNLIAAEISQLKDEIMYQEEQQDKIIQDLEAELQTKNALIAQMELITLTPENAISLPFDALNTTTPIAHQTIIEPIITTPIIEPIVTTPVIEPIVTTPVIEPIITTPVIEPIVTTPVVYQTGQIIPIKIIEQKTPVTEDIVTPEANKDVTSTVSPAVTSVIYQTGQIIPIETLPMTTEDSNNTNKIATPTVSLENHEIVPHVENGLQLAEHNFMTMEMPQNDQLNLDVTPEKTVMENQTIPLENHPVIHQSEDGFKLPDHSSQETKESLIPTLKVENPKVQPMTSVQIAPINEQNDMNATSEEEMLNKLDSTK